MNDFLSVGNEKKILSITLDKISEKNINPRKEGLVEENLKSLIEAGGDFPPVHLGYLNGELIVVDGYHRLEATKQLGLDKISVYITEYKSEEQIKTDAINENIVHGVRLGDYDVAMSLYELYKTITEKQPLTSLTQFLQYFKMPERRGKQLLFWSILHKTILEDAVDKVQKASLAEEILMAFSTKFSFNFLIGTVAEENKIRIKKFFEKYCDVSRETLREALKAMKEDKDIEKDDIITALQEKKEKLQEAKEVVKIEAEQKKFEEEFKEETSMPALKENVVEEKSFEETEESNSVIENLIEKKEEVVSDIKEQVKPVDNVPDLFEKNLESLESSIMRTRMYQKKRPTLIDKKILAKIINFQDILQEIIEEANEELYKEQEIKDVI